MKLIAREASAESLEGVGILATPATGQEPQSGAEFTFELAEAELGMPGELCAGRLSCAARPMLVTKMEMHLLTPELLSAVDGDALLCVAPPQEPRGGKLEGMRAVLIKRGQAIVLAPGAWHWIPFPTGGDAVRFLVVFRAKTGDDDLHFCDLAETATLVSQR
jgi:ureidoglycolate hydrolase